MQKVSSPLTTNSRLIKDHLTKYRSTFLAFCELVNNSIQAGATRIDIEIGFSGRDFRKSPISSLKIKDNGRGVSFSQFKRKILEIATTDKEGGHGIGRFGALQIGEKMIIDTISYDVESKKNTRVYLEFDSSVLNDSNLSSTSLDYQWEELPKSRLPYYQVSIEGFHHDKQDRIPKRNRVSPEFSPRLFSTALFESYPYQIFNHKVKFFVNGDFVDPDRFVEGVPSVKKLIYTDIKEDKHEIFFYFYKIKAQLNKVKVFFQLDNAGIKNIGHEFTYSSDWYTPDQGTWFIYLDSPLFNSDLFRNLDVEELGDVELKNLKEFVKDAINGFFKARNRRYSKFLNLLEKDEDYPYRNRQAPSVAQELLFKKLAYVVEDEYELLKKSNKIKRILYPLIDRSLSEGHIADIFGKILKLSADNMSKFNELLNRTSIESVIKFTSHVGSKIEFIRFLHDLTYGELSKYILERSQLHKIIEKELWIFGEAYNGTPVLWSDKRIGNILNEIREKYFGYEPSETDENLIEIEVDGLNNITDLFFYSEKILDSEQKEIMIVELKSPKCAIGLKELNQIDGYAYTLENYVGLPNENVKYKMILISSKLTDFARSKIKSSREKYQVPFLYDRKSKRNIELYVLEWAELIELNNRKLAYLSEKLEISDRPVKDKFEKEYTELISEKINSILRRVV